MTNFKKQVFSVIAAGSLLVSVATPALAADTSITIGSNGAGSDNYTQVNQTNTNTVTQNNTANVTNNVTSNADTGHNNAGFNTNGDVTIGTGNAKTAATVTNNLNVNTAQVTGCNCAGGTDVKVSGNGADTDNTITLGDTNTNTVAQTNNATVSNNIDNTAKTGGNDADSNTGGSVAIGTGNATSVANVTTVANANSAAIGAAAGAGAGNNSASFVISGNGAGSDNFVTATLANVNTAIQNNTAHVTNDVDADALTGGNDAGFNTGGDVMIGTGNAGSGATVDNAVNFNSANLDCGCVTDVLAKISGNGANSDWGWWNNEDPNNTIELGLDNTNTVGQGNGATLYNDVDANAKTGANDAFKNTGSVLLGDDPEIGTGNATNVSDVSNSGNVNTVGGTPIVIPMGNTNVGFSFNFQALMAFFGMTI